MATLEVLKAAYHLLDDKARWTTCAQARTTYGEFVTANDPRAVAWCAAGAVFRVGGGMADLRPLADAIEPGCEIWRVPLVNNGPDGYELIREAFRKAIADLEPPIKRAPRKKELVAV